MHGFRLDVTVKGLDVTVKGLDVTVKGLDVTVICYLLRQLVTLVRP